MRWNLQKVLFSLSCNLFIPATTFHRAAFSWMVSLFFLPVIITAFPLDLLIFTHKFSPSLFISSAFPSFVFTSSYYPLTEILKSVWGPHSLNCSLLLFPMLLLPSCSYNSFPVPTLRGCYTFLVLLSMKDHFSRIWNWPKGKHCRHFYRLRKSLSHKVLEARTIFKGSLTTIPVLVLLVPSFCCPLWVLRKWLMPVRKMILNLDWFLSLSFNLDQFILQLQKQI